MGSSETKFAYQKCAYELRETVVPPENAEFWNKFWTLAQTVDDVFTVLNPDDVREVRKKNPQNLVTLLQKAVSVMAAVEQTREKATPKDHVLALNAVRVITRLLPLIFEDNQDGFADRLFWGISGQPTTAPESPLGERLIRHLYGLMFLPNFTVADPQVPPPGPNQGYPSGYSWYPGVMAPSVLPTYGYADSHRTELLRCLLACLSGTLYRSPQHEDPAYAIKFLETACTPLPQSFALFLSLINCCISYDPVGWGVPYNYILARDYKEPLAMLSLQILVVLLSAGPKDSTVTLASAPAPAQPAPAPPATSKRVTNAILHHFRELQKAEDFQLVTAAIIRILNNPIVAHNTYLPGAKKQVAFHQEMLMLLWRLLLENKHYVSYLLKRPDSTDEVLKVVRAILHFVHEGRKDPAQLGLVHLGTFVLLFLSGEREFSVALNAPVIAKSTMTSFPPFSGTHADELVLVVYRLLTDSQRRLDSLHECLLTILANISPYVKDLCGPACMSLLKLFEMLARPTFVFASERNHRYLFFLLETFNNLIQYQYAGNSRLIYAIIRNREVFNQLANIQLPAKFAVSPMPPAALQPASPQPAPAIPQPAAVAPQSTASLGDASHAGSPSAANVAAISPSASGLDMVKSKESVFVPTIPWLQAWKAQLPITTVLRLLAAIIPQISNLIEGSATDEAQILAFLQKTTLVGLIPVPHPILIRQYSQNQNRNPPIFLGTHPKLFVLQQEK